MRRRLRRAHYGWLLLFGVGLLVLLSGCGQGALLDTDLAIGADSSTVSRSVSATNTGPVSTTGYPQLYPIRVGELYGFIDRTGNVVVEPKFPMVWGFSEGLAAIAGADLEHYDGYVDATGKFVIKTTFAWADNFHEGVAAVVQNDKWGYIDRTGGYALRPTYDYALAFSEGLAGVLVGDEWGFIDVSGNLVIAPQFSDVGSFREGIAPVETLHGWRFIDKNGNCVAEPKDILDLGTLHDGLACASVWDQEREEKLWGFVDRTGRWVIEPRFEDAQGFGDGLAPVYQGGVEDPVLHGGKWGYIDTGGRYVIEPRFARADEFQDGLAWVETVDRMWAYIDTEGDVVWSNPVPPGWE